METGSASPAMAATKPASDFRRLYLREMTLDAYIGAYPEEREHPQRVRLDIDAKVEDRQVNSDQLSHVVSYELLRDAVHAVVAAGHINLVETLAERVAAACLAHPQIIEVTIRAEKLDVFNDCAGAGVELVRTR